MNCKAFGRQSLPGEVQEIITCMVTDIRYISTLHIQFENMSRPGHVGGVMSPESWHSQSWLLHDDHQRKLDAAVHGGCSDPDLERHNACRCNTRAKNWKRSKLEISWHPKVQRKSPLYADGIILTVPQWNFTDPQCFPSPPYISRGIPSHNFIASFQGFLSFLFFRKGKSPVYTLELSHKSNFQLSTTKPDNRGHPTLELGKFDLLGGFEGDFLFCEN